MRVGISMYGAVVKDGFPIIKFLRKLHKHGHDLTRVFGMHMRAALQGRLAWKKSDDGRYDLTRLDKKYVYWLILIALGSKFYGITVIFSILEECGFETGATRWSVNPFRKSNNINGIGQEGGKSGVRYLHSDDLLHHCSSYFKMVISVLSYVEDNFIIEVCNEPTGGKAWETKVRDLLRSYGWSGRIMTKESSISDFYGRHIHRVEVPRMDNRAIVSNDGRGMSMAEGRRMKESAKRAGCWGFEFWPIKDNIDLCLPRDFNL